MPTNPQESVAQGPKTQGLGARKYLGLEIKLTLNGCLKDWLTCAQKINAQYYRFDLTGFGEALQLTNYDQSENGMYGWHQDYGGSVSRKLSMAVQLTDPSEYEGGNLQVMTSAEPQNIRKQRGANCNFPFVCFTPSHSCNTGKSSIFSSMGIGASI